MLSLHFLAYLQIGSNKKRDVKIWVPPKAKPVLPFGLGPPAEVAKPEDYTETTYAEYEMKLLKESAQGTLMSVGISMFMSFKFNVHVSLIIQSVSGPVTAIDNIVLRKYIVGMTSDKGYGEFLTQPTAEDIARLNGEEPRVVELKEESKEEKNEEKKEEKKVPSRACAAVPSSSSVTEID